MQAFANIRVLDLTHIIAGPFCTFQLGVMGADVIKIENTVLGDSLREDGGNLEASKEKMDSDYITQSANKRSIAVDLGTQECPLSDRTAYDNVIQAMSGLMATTGKPDSGAVKVGPPVLDYGTGI